MTLLDNIVPQIAEAGFDVYMRKPLDSYAYFTDGQRIGYVQEDRLQPPTLSTVHIPNRTSGTGFGLGSPKTFDRASLEDAFITAPQWADGASRKSVKKWPNLEAFLKGNDWGGGLKLVASGGDKPLTKQG